MRNSLAPFQFFNIYDNVGGRIIEKIQNPSLLGQVSLSCQRPEFWAGTSSIDQGGVAQASDRYGCGVRTFRESAYYFNESIRFKQNDEWRINSNCYQ